MSDESDRTRLVRARNAWGQMLDAESQLSRLASYKHLSAGMKEDRRRWMRQFADARATLTGVLNGPNYRLPPPPEPIINPMDR